MEKVSLVVSNGDIHDQIDYVLWNSLLEFVNVPRRVVPEPVNRDMKIAVSAQDIY